MTEFNLNNFNEKELHEQLQALVQAGDAVRAKEMLDAGVPADGYFNTDEYYPPLGDAIINRDLPMIQLLLAEGADPNGRIGPKRHSMVAESIDKECFPAMCLLLGAGANVDNRPSIVGSGPLSVSVRHRNAPEFMETLLDAGADPQLRDTNFHNAEVTARKYHSPDLGDFLKAWKVAPRLFDNQWEDAATDGIKRSTLFEPSEKANGKTLMHAPSSWDAMMDFILPALKVEDETLTREDLFTPIEAAGITRSYAESAVRMFKTDQLIALLDAIGQPLKSSDLIDPQGELTELGVATIETWQFDKVLKSEIWKDGAVKDLSAYHDALSEEQQEIVGNYHQLKSAVQQSGKQVQRIR